MTLTVPTLSRTAIGVRGCTGGCSKGEEESALSLAPRGCDSSGGWSVTGIQESANLFRDDVQELVVLRPAEGKDNTDF